MASKSSRARQLERARAERRMARLAEHQRRRRRVQAAIGGALAVILIGLGTTWLLGGFDKKATPVASPTCTWTARDTTLAGVVDTGLPSDQVPTTGDEVMTISTNLGDITASVDLADSFCAAGSMQFLGGLGFYNSTHCHKLDTTNTTLTCGSKTGDDASGPNYQFPTEGIPHPQTGTAADGTTPSYYPQGSILMANLDVNAVGSQFMIVYGTNSPLPDNYTRVGTISTGLDLIQQIAQGGAVDANGASAAVGKPVKDLTISSLTIADSNDGAAATATATPQTTTT